MGSGTFQERATSSTKLQSNGAKAREHILTLPPSQPGSKEAAEGTGQEDPTENRAFAYTEIV